jgi:hypothetical protein
VVLGGVRERHGRRRKSVNEGMEVLYVRRYVQYSTFVLGFSSRTARKHAKGIFEAERLNAWANEVEVSRAGGQRTD